MVCHVKYDNTRTFCLGRLGDGQQWPSPKMCGPPAEISSFLRKLIPRHGQATAHASIIPGDGIKVKAGLVLYQKSRYTNIRICTKQEGAAYVAEKKKSIFMEFLWCNRTPWNFSGTIEPRGNSNPIWQTRYQQELEDEAKGIGKKRGYFRLVIVDKKKSNV